MPRENSRKVTQRDSFKHHIDKIKNRVLKNFQFTLKRARKKESNILKENRKNNRMKNKMPDLSLNI